MPSYLCYFLIIYFEGLKILKKCTLSGLSFSTASMKQELDQYNDYENTHTALKNDMRAFVATPLDSLLMLCFTNDCQTVPFFTSLFLPLLLYSSILRSPHSFSRLMPDNLLHTGSCPRHDQSL